MIRICLYLLLSIALPAQAGNFSLVVQGLGGTPDYEEAFSRDARAIAAAAGLLSRSPARYVFLNGERATRENILQELGELTKAMSSDDSFSLTLIGHGSFDGREFKFNLPGKDLDGQALLDALAGIPAQRQLVVIASSSSGAMLERLAAPGRTVVTATKNGRESNAVSFSRHWAGALVSESADTNKDELLSSVEAFRFAEKKVEEYYKSQNLLAPEHPRMVANDSTEFYLARMGALAGSEDNPRIAAFLEQRLELAEAFFSLKNRKAQLDEADYLDSLQDIMLKLARLQKTIDSELTDGEGADENS